MAPCDSFSMTPTFGNCRSLYDPEIVSGAPVFRHTRVPVEAFISNLEDGMSLEKFLENFPSVSREQVVQVLEFLNVTLKKLANTS